jgi:hypothetical protein
MTKPDQAEPVRVTLADFEPFSECDQPLTDQQVKAIRNMAYYRALLMRAQAKWSPEEEAAFLNGACCAFFACKSHLKIPAFWIMSNSPLLDVLDTWKAEGKLEGGA